MFNILPNVKTRDIISSVSLSDLIEIIKKPSPFVKYAVDTARKFGKGSAQYSRIKLSLPAFVPNYTHDAYVKADTSLESTGYLYIDLDEDVKVDFSKFPFVAAAWNSLSKVGTSILVSVENMPPARCPKTMIQDITEEVATIMGINCDFKAISRDRLIAIAYDENPYYNPNHIPYNNILKEEEVKSTQSRVKKKESLCGYRLRVDDNFISDTLRLSNFNEVVSGYKFEDDEVFKDLGDNKLYFTDIFIPKKIENGERNAKLYNIFTKLYGLNPNAEKSVLYKFMLSVNSSSCDDPLSDNEVLDICTKVLSNEPVLYANKKRTYIYNEDYMLTGKERTSIAVTESNKKRGIDTTDNIFKVLENWDFNKLGKITYNKIALEAKIGKATVARRCHDIKKIIKDLNNNLVKSL